MKILLTLILLLSSCTSLPVEPRIKHVDRRYRTCTEKETKDPQKYVCFRYCYERWFKKRCKLIIKDRTSPEFDDFVFVHSSKL